MVNKGVKRSMNLPETQGRPPKSFKWSIGNQKVPAQVFYKWSRNQNNQIKSAQIQQEINNQRQQFKLQHSPTAIERRAVFLQEGRFMGDINNEPDLYRF